ncbi:helix-turn-helix domain-containing protein [Ruminococcaceae bacterium OttesenSCG-928-L11]|nr:helix-turn-helix domain-containing protein [Ruminococcaceae bacterium OttesenSCG-928-L11]
MIKKHGLLIRWVFSYVLIIVMTLLISTASYLFALGELKKESQKAFQASAEQLYQNVDMLLSNAEQLTLQLEKSDRVLSLLFDLPQKQNVRTLYTYRVVTDFAVHKSINQTLNQLYLYLIDEDKIVSNRSSYLTADYFAYHGGGRYYSYDDWMETLEGSQFATWRTVDRPSSDVCFTLTHSIAKQLRGSAKAQLVLEFDRTAITDMIHKLQWTEEASVYILDQNGRLCLATGEHGADAINGLTAGGDPQALTKVSIDGEEYMASILTSPKTGWKFVSLLSDELYSKSADTALAFYIAAILAAIVFGGIISFFLARHNFTPVNKLVDLLAGNLQSGKDGHNEFQYIEKRIVRILTEKQELDMTVTQQERMLRRHFLEQLISGGMESSFDFQQLCERHDIDLSLPCYMTAIFQVTRYAPEVFRTAAAEPEQQETAQLVALVVENIADEMINELCTAYFAEVSGQIAAILNFTPEQAPDMLPRIRSTVLRLQEILSAHFQIEISVAVSSVSRIASTKKLYREAQEALEYADTTNEAVISYPEVFESFSQLGDSSLEYEWMLLNCVQVHDYENAIDTASRLFAYYLEDEEAAGRIQQLRLHSMTHRMMTVLETVIKRGDIDPAQARATKSRLYACEDLPALRDLSLELLRETSSYSKNKRLQINDEKIRAIWEYVQDNYADPQISVSAIADRFAVSTPYLSKAFKQHYEEGLLDSINKLRISRAKQLIAAGGCSVAEASEQVGFSNVQTFIRVYKKYEGTTPGKAKGKK